MNNPSSDKAVENSIEYLRKQGWNAIPSSQRTFVLPDPKVTRCGGSSFLNPNRHPVSVVSPQGRLSLKNAGDCTVNFSLHQGGLWLPSVTTPSGHYRTVRELLFSAKVMAVRYLWIVRHGLHPV